MVGALWQKLLLSGSSHNRYCFFRLEVVGGFKDITCALVQEENNVEYLVATTSIITGESFIESLATKLEAPTF